MKKLAVILAVLAASLAWTNPSQADHQRAFADSFKAENPVLGFFGVGTAASSLVGYDSHVFISVGRVGDRVVSVGLLGKVFTREIPVERKIREELGG